MAKKKQHHEEHVDETWLIPYSDMLTLLLALFIVMFAMSQADKQKMKQVSEQFRVVFSGDKSSGVLDNPGEAVVPSESSNSAVEEDKMNEIKQTLDKEIEKSGYSDRVKVNVTKEGLEISIQDVVLFNSGDDKILNETSPLLLEVSKSLVNLDNSIKIVGHTDTIPIKNVKFHSNWELSAMRAINVMNFLVDSGGLQPERFSIQGYGQYMPKFDNSTEEGRAKNRRVEIFVVRKYPADKEVPNKTDQKTN
ncbi:OmpA family protein [Clostridium sp. CX1]|uniref:flagellar motor protein MotB n=1 Tax=Clostridium sp. CX1 TaxID=2978346 RepID=UPI0021C18045|nr:flagellar motor protein MotB [Clostridium sp. CX1]MCT8976401.1 OmpA family protein [Clostridium sp. CX1]